jgi:hypothetical protein
MRALARSLGHTHASLPRAQSEHAAARSAQDLDSDVVLFGAQLSQRLADRLVDGRGGSFNRIA